MGEELPQCNVFHAVGSVLPRAFVRELVDHLPKFVHHVAKRESDRTLLWKGIYQRSSLIDDCPEWDGVQEMKVFVQQFMQMCHN